MTRGDEMSTVVPLIDAPKGPLRRYAWRYSRKMFGTVADPLRALAHHGGVLVANGALEMAVAKSWDKIDPHLRWLAVQATGGQIGCSWCTDFGYYEGVQTGVDPRKIRDVPRWRDSEVYTDVERVVLEYAEAATASPVVLTDELVEGMHRHFDDEQIVELVAWVALENYRSRINAGLGLHSQGFADACQVVPVGP
jgi:alkylhydroperoxidase family enzyme